MLGQQYFENKTFQEYFSSHFVMFRADRTQQVGEKIFTKFNIMGTPTVMILDADGSAIDWHVGYTPPPRKFHEKIDKSYRGIGTYRFYTDQYAKDPKNLDVVFHLAKKYGDRYDQEKATTLYKEVLAIDPDGKKGSTEYDTTKVSYTQYAEFQMASLSLYGAKGGPEGFRSFLRKYRDGELTRSAYVQLAFFYAHADPQDTVTQFYEGAVKEYPNDVNLLSAYVEYISNSKKNVDRGIEVAERILAIRKYEKDPRYVRDLAELYAMKGDTSKADSIYGKTFIDDQVSSLSYGLIDYANFWAGQKMNTESALAMAEMSLKMNPDNSSLVRQVARVCCKLNKIDRALELFGPTYVDKNISDANKLYSYANFWTGEEKNLESALAAARKAVELSPATPYYWGVLAIVHQKMKNYDEAIRIGEKAVELADENQKAYYRRRLDAIKQSRQEGGGQPKEGK